MIYHLYGDDIIIISPENNSRMNDCIIELHNWMTTNYVGISYLYLYLYLNYKLNPIIPIPKYQ